MEILRLIRSFSVVSFTLNYNIFYVFRLCPPEPLFLLPNQTSSLFRGRSIVMSLNSLTSASISSLPYHIVFSMALSPSVFCLTSPPPVHLYSRFSLLFSLVDLSSVLKLFLIRPSRCSRFQANFSCEVWKHSLPTTRICF